MSQPSALSLQRLSVGYPRRTVLDTLNTELLVGELVCLIGPNGAGKSTLLRTLAGMQPPLSGRALLRGDEVHKLDARERAKRLSVVLTDRLTVEEMTAYALVSLGRYPHTDWSGKLSAHDDQVIRWALAAVGAAAFAERDIHELSDGERQKVLIARALAQEPAVMLLDEPTAYLDLPRRVEILRTLRDLAHDTQCAILLSTHDLDLALRTADQIWLVSEGSLHIGAPEDLILNGAFEAAFRSTGIEFDRLTGSFHIHTPAAHTVQLIAEGINALWTQRALERAGFAVAHQPANFRISVTTQGKTHWQLSIHGETFMCDSLYAVVQRLRTIILKRYS
jgi:iron complex transport system ATP-binding protein